MNKKIISLILAIATLVSVFAISAVPAYAAIYEQKNKILSYQPDYPLKEFPSDTSYFNDFHFDNDGKEKPCGHHSDGKNDKCSYQKIGVCDCTIYDSSIQCMAFAKYASDQYAHRTSFTFVSGDTIDTTNVTNTKKDRSFSDWETAKKELDKLDEGCYVRVHKKGATDVKKGHSFILLSVSDSGVTVYDANYHYTCKVWKHTISKKDFIKNYDKIQVTMSHKFTKTPVSFDKTYHKIACSSSGCTGYKLEKHTSFTYSKKNDTYHWKTCKKCDVKIAESHTITNNGGSSKCIQCGCVLPQVASIPPVGDEIASIDDEAVVADNVTITENDETTSADYNITS